MPNEKDVEKGPGDAKTDVKRAPCRGDEGDSSAKGGKEGEVEYGR